MYVQGFAARQRGDPSTLNKIGEHITAALFQYFSIDQRYIVSTMVMYSKGERVKIIAGTYKTNGMGTFQKIYGIKMATVSVDGDSRPKRNIWLSSIQKMDGTGSTATTNNADVTIKRKDYEKLLADIASLQEALTNLELKVKKMDNK